MKKLDINKLNKLISILEDNPVIEFTEAKTTETGGIILPYPIYPDWVFEMFTLLTPDYEYINLVDFIEKNKIEVENYNIDQARAMLTWAERGERFCDGHIYSLIENGFMVKLLKRIAQIHNEL